MKQKKIEFILAFLGLMIFLVFFNSPTLAQVGGARTPLKIVHLGDSYSAGNGARSGEGDRNYYSVSGCYRSPTNWGSQFAESLKDVFTVTYINRACSGGVLSQILEPRDMDDPSFKDLNGSCPTPEYPDEEFYVDTSLLRCSRFINPQIDAIDSSVDLVLMTMGGNDLGFDEIVKNCFVVRLRSARGCEAAVNGARDGLSDLEDDLIDKFGHIRDKLRSEARIAYVSYPHLLLDVPYGLVDDAGTEDQYIYNAGARIRELATLGDAYQIAAVEAANAAAGEEYVVLYNGTKALFAGHEPHPSSEVRNPERWIYEFEGSIFSPLVSIKEWYHPNALGHENWGEALSVFGTFGAAGGEFDTNANIDVVFVVDTTGSMGGEIAQVRADLSSLVGQLASTTDSYRVAVVSYRDFPERTGSSNDYPFRVDQTFTDDLGLIQAAIDSLSAQGGGDEPETVFSGVQAAIDLTWRPGVTKIAIVIGDAPALSPEPISNLTASQIVANSIAVDPVQVIGVDVGSLNSNGASGEISVGTGGSIIPGTSGLTTVISEILDQAANQPFAWIGQAYSGKIGQPILFDASGSYDPSGLPITLYEWDFDGDGAFDFATTDAIATYTYDTAFNGFVVLRVTGNGGTALSSARTVVNAEGFVSQGDEALCELDENGFSIILDEEGNFIRCTPDSLANEDKEGVMEVNNQNQLPTADAGGPFAGNEGSLITLDASDSFDPDGTIVAYEWDLDNDGEFDDATGVITEVVFGDSGTFTVRLRVTDDFGESNTDTAEVVVFNLPPGVNADPSIQEVQYSDYIADVTVTATDVASDPLQVVGTNWSVDEGSFVSGLPSGLSLTNEGCTANEDTNTCTWTLSGFANLETGEYVVQITVEDDDGGQSSVDVTITVLPEDATVAYDINNPVAMRVVEDGGNSGPFSLIVHVSETQPDQPTAQGTPGDISLANVSMSLVPIGPGGLMDGVCTSGAVNGSGYDAALPIICSFDDVPVNTYTAQVLVDGGYYLGGSEDVLVVYDPSLGFTTGGGWFYWPGTGERTNFGFNMKYNRKGKNIQGNLLLIRHMPDGSIYRVKSNALNGLALGDNLEPLFGWASFSGRSTYQEPGWPEPVGNHKFIVYVEDRNEPGNGIDRFWIEIKDKDGNVIHASSMAREATDNAIELQGGDIVAPH